MDNEAQIAKFLIASVEAWDEGVFGSYYRASAYLRDGTYLPCVMFGNPRKIIDLAIRRFPETADDEYQHRLVVESFVARKAAVPIYDVAKVEPSPYAWPEQLVRQIQGETVMGWTSFTAKMSDGKMFTFGTPFHSQFFDLPKGYSYNDISEIHSGMVLSEDGREEPFSHDWDRPCYRDKPFFYCYTDCLPETPKDL